MTDNCGMYNPKPKGSAAISGRWNHTTKRHETRTTHKAAECCVAYF